MPNANPTNSDYLSLINAAEQAGDVTGWHAMSGVPHGEEINPATGFGATAYVNDVTGQVVIAFIGPNTAPGLGSIAGQFHASPGGTATDEMIANGLRPTQYETDVKNFVQQVLNTLSAQDPSADFSNVYVAGSSLGGYAAQIAAMTFGLGGVNYGGPGVPLAAPSTAVDNFMNQIILGDPVANGATDTGIDWGSISVVGPHYGQVKFLGDQANQVKQRV